MLWLKVVASLLAVVLVVLVGLLVWRLSGSGSQSGATAGSVSSATPVAQPTSGGAANATPVVEQSTQAQVPTSQFPDANKDAAAAFSKVLDKIDPSRFNHSVLGTYDENPEPPHEFAYALVDINGDSLPELLINAGYGGGDRLKESGDYGVQVYQFSPESGRVNRLKGDAIFGSQPDGMRYVLYGNKDHNKLVEIAEVAKNPDQPKHYGQYAVNAGNLERDRLFAIEFPELTPEVQAKLVKLTWHDRADRGAVKELGSKLSEYVAVEPDLGISGNRLLGHLKGKLFQNNEGFPVRREITFGDDGKASGTYFGVYNIERDDITNFDIDVKFGSPRKIDEDSYELTLESAKVHDARNGEKPANEVALGSLANVGSKWILLLPETPIRKLPQDAIQSLLPGDAVDPHAEAIESYMLYQKEFPSAVLHGHTTSVDGGN
ncbi:hypothetical protein J2S49_001294 [Arcanobacterium wilhelmae]|uniref:Uncharacterized protein n=1 Tax=Arcanobacterium wilhelmae TaxID=1803177 RepID=A0ABT9NBY1_9ACTO|nr:hypothetical protein [Arcanobacterium wilhelmae]MDP9801218.1 hypothetical protein [Arcanobacterium wilhelmae]WFN90567.1 hypothetical protein P8A24_01535 [Arcanobacterium wilhelmae]